MVDTRPVPSGLIDLVSKSLSPGCQLDGSTFDFLRNTYEFRLDVRGEYFPFDIPREYWEDKREEFISLLARLASPSPDATLGGARIWLRLSQINENSDSLKYGFDVVEMWGSSPVSHSTTLTGTALSMLCTEGNRRRLDEDAFCLAAATWAIKDQLDSQGERHRGVSSSTVARLVSRPTATDQEVRRYVKNKLYAGYRSAGLDISLRFDWVDQGYLGICPDFRGKRKMA